MEKGKNKYRLFSLYLLAVFFFISAGVILAGHLYHRAETEEVIKASGKDVESVAILKVKQISDWRRERIGDAAFASRSAALNSFLEGRLAGKNGALRDVALRRMEDLRKDYGYKGVILCDTAGNKIIAAPEDEDVTDIGRGFVLETIRENKVVFADIHRYGDTGYPHLAILAPVAPADGQPALGVIMLRAGLDPYLYPTIKSWPVPSRTAETLLVRREGDEVVYLNDLRFRENAALSLRSPADAADLPAAMAVRGKEGTAEGTDYRGKKVLAAMRRVPDSPWYLVAKMDMEEVLAPVRGEFRQMAGTVFAVVLAALLALLVVWERQRVRILGEEKDAQIRELALEKHYDYLAKYANDAIILADKDLKLAQANDRALAVYGYSREEMIGMPVEMLRAPEEREAFRKYIRNIGPEGAIVETEHITRDGWVFPVEVSVRRITVEGSEFYQGVMRDISERKKAEKKLENALADWRETFDATSDSIMLLGKDYRIIMANKATETLFNRPQNEITGNYCYKLMHGTDEPIDECPLTRMTRTRTHEEAEVNPPGTDKWLYVSVDPILDENKEISRVVHIVKDVTEKKKTEEELKRSESRYRGIIRTTQDGFWYVDEEGHFLDVNDAACKMLGYGRDELLKMKIADVEKQEDETLVIRHIAKMRDTGGDRFETKHRRKDGSVVDVEVITSFVRDAEKNERIFVFVRDITDRKKAEEAVRTERQRLHSVLEVMPMMVCLLTPDYHVAFANRAFREKFGESHGRHCYEYCFGKKEPCDFCESFTPLKTGRSHRWEVTSLDGATVIEAYDFPFTDTDGSPMILEVDVDITDRKKAEEAVQKSEAMFKGVVTAVPIGIGIALDRIIQWLNRNFYDLLGYDEGEIVGKDAGLLYESDEVYGHVGKKFYDELQEKGTASIETRWKRKDGRLLDIHLTGSAINKDDISQGVVFAGMDITERRKADEELKKLAAVIRHSSELVNIATPDGTMVFLNEAGSKMLGITPIEVTKHKITDVICEDSREKVFSELLPALEKGASWEGELAYRNLRTNAVTDVYAMTFVIEDPRSGGVLYYVNVSRDITARKNTEKELALYRLHLEDLVKERTAELESFSYSVSHDLRAPLRAIDGFVRILSDEYGSKFDDEGRRLTDVIVENTRNMGRLIDDLLAFSRLGRKEPEISEIDMTEAAGRIGESAVNSEAGRNIKLNIGALPPARGDRAMIELALVNLLSNAVKFTRKNKKASIEVTGKEEGKEKVYCVKDNGVGFDMRYGEKLFGVFQRLHSAEEFEGTGIGLAIVKRIVAKHGGRVWAEGEVGKGAAFFFSLPKRSS